MYETNYSKQQERGVAILFAILLVSIVLTVGLSLLNITLRQLLLSSLARESQFAFYAADSARACARYYDSLDNPEERPFGYFFSNSGVLAYEGPVGALNLTCGDGLSPVTSSAGVDSSTFSFTVSFGNSIGKKTCAEVMVSKYTGGGAELEMGKTRIVARGYNNYDSGSGGGCYQVSDRTVERASTMIY